MTGVKKRKTLINVLSIFIILIYIYLSAGVFGAYLTEAEILGMSTIERLNYMNYFSSGVGQLFSLLIIPVTTIVLLNIKEIELEKRFLLCRILVLISTLVILINLVLLNLVYYIWVISEWADVLIWGPFFGYSIAYFVEFLLSLVICVLLTIKLNEK